MIIFSRVGSVRSVGQNKKVFFPLKNDIAMNEATTIKANTNISDIIGRYINLKRNGVNYVGLCPFHDERSPSLVCNDSRGIYKCFGCGAAGDVIDFVSRIEGVGFNEAITILDDGSTITNHIHRKPKAELPLFSIPEARLLNAYNQDYSTATLYQFFTGLFPAEIVRKVFDDYKVMAGANGLNVFPNVDINGSIRQVKELTADPTTGKRSHVIPPRINGITFLSAEEKENHQLKQCFFGEHLLSRYPNRDVIICESEKTALGMSIVEAITDPDNCGLWLATGGKNGVRMTSQTTIAPLTGRKVYLMPDNDAVNDWRAYLKPINKIAECHLVDAIADKENAADKAKYDIWDYTLEAFCRNQQLPFSDLFARWEHHLTTHATPTNEMIEEFRAAIVKHNHEPEFDPAKYPNVYKLINNV